MSATQMCINDLRGVIKDKEEIVAVAMLELANLADRLAISTDTSAVRTMLLTKLKSDAEEILTVLHEINGIHEGIRNIG